MIFELQHKYIYVTYIGKIISREFWLGVFDSWEKTEKAIAHYKQQPGFSDYPDGFYIRPIKISNAEKVYRASYSYVGKSEADDIELSFGLFISFEEAHAEIECWKQYLPNASEEDFSLCICRINQMDWQEGFSSE